MSGLTVTEKNHWRDRIAARIDRRIEMILAADPGLMSRVQGEARSRALESLGLAEHQAELDSIAKQKEALDKREWRIRRTLLAQVRGMPVEESKSRGTSVLAIRSLTPRSPSGKAFTRSSCLPSTKWVARSCSSAQRRTTCWTSCGWRLRRSRCANSGPALGNCWVRSRRTWRRKPGRSSLSTWRVNEKAVSKSASKAERKSTAASLQRMWASDSLNPPLRYRAWMATAVGRGCPGLIYLLAIRE